jgi:hypothetical protein
MLDENIEIMTNEFLWVGVFYLIGIILIVKSFVDMVDMKQTVLDLIWIRNIRVAEWGGRDGFLTAIRPYLVEKRWKELHAEIEIRLSKKIVKTLEDTLKDLKLLKKFIYTNGEEITAESGFGSFFAIHGAIIEFGFEWTDNFREHYQGIVPKFTKKINETMEIGQILFSEKNKDIEISERLSDKLAKIVNGIYELDVILLNICWRLFLDKLIENKSDSYEAKVYYKTGEKDFFLKIKHKIATEEDPREIIVNNKKGTYYQALYLGVLYLSNSQKDECTIRDQSGKPTTFEIEPTLDHAPSYDWNIDWNEFLNKSFFNLGYQKAFDEYLEDYLSWCDEQGELIWEKWRETGREKLQKKINNSEIGNNLTSEKVLKLMRELVQRELKIAGLKDYKIKELRLELLRELKKELEEKQKWLEDMLGKK